MMGYKTPNIDRIAKEGALFTDWYAPADAPSHPGWTAAGRTETPGTPSLGRSLRVD